MSDNHNMLRNVLRDRGGYISINQHDTAGVVDHVPAQIYEVGMSENGLLLVKDRKSFTVPERKYGKHMAWFKAVTSRYDRLNPSMGVIMVGLKGSGKSMLAEDICNWGIAQDLPVLFINQKIPVQLIHSAVSSIGPCIVYFDEFGKSYRASDDSSVANERDTMITLFSDSSHRGVLFIATGNGFGEFSDFMIDRPGRFEFRLNFGGLTVQSAADIAAEFKLNPDMREILLRHTANNSSSYDVATKLASSLRNCKNIQEAVDMVDILNIPRLAWYYYAIAEVRYHGEKISSKHVTATTDEDDIVKLVIRDENYDELETAVIDMMTPSATLLDDKNPKVVGYLPLGRYSLKVNEHLTIVFDRSLQSERQRMHCHAASAAEEQENIQRAEEYNSNHLGRPKALMSGLQGDSSTYTRHVVSGAYAVNR
jgi:hypothetical protein